ncbi:hypothetical protein CDAR_176911 [Caerostris darwini]|uniref:Uncharacterized protein n=1 Tax=Caerostris darwini TaxID=1538125 RepID=A0AAV4RFM7_9ARAC|nr:hypothetical protein CDAR_176911 [Caerostris darwini]
MKHAIHNRVNTISSYLFLKAISLVGQVRDLFLEHTIQKNFTIIPKFSTELFRFYYILHGFFQQCCSGSKSIGRSRKQLMGRFKFFNTSSFKVVGATRIRRFLQIIHGYK